MKKSAFTLVELLIVIIIIGILATIAVPQYQKMANKAKWSEVAQMYGAIKRYSMVYYQEHGHLGMAWTDYTLNGPNAVDVGFYITIPPIRPDGRFFYVLRNQDNPPLDTVLLVFIDSTGKMMGNDPFIRFYFDGTSSQSYNGAAALNLN